MDWVQLKPSVTLSNVIPPNNLLYNSYFENFNVELYVFNINANFHVNWMLFTVQTHLLCIILNYKNLNLNN